MHMCILVYNELTRALDYPPYVCFCSQHWNQGGYGDFQGSYGNVRLHRQMPYYLLLYCSLIPALFVVCVEVVEH